MSAPETGPVPQTRRGVLAVLAGTVASLFALRWRKVLASEGAPSAAPTGTSGGPRPRWGMVIDLDKCTGCQGCVASCKAENNVPVVGPALLETGRGIFWMDLLRKHEGRYPDLRTELMPVPCNHCENPSCVKVCPVGATYQSDEGITAQIWDRCIGCRYCAAACPYGRRYFNWEAPAWTEAARSALNPDVATRPVGVVEKCTFCYHRIRKAREKARAEGRPLSDEDVRKLPACAQACPAGAIVFGDLDDPSSEVLRLSKSPRAFRLLEECGTRPKVVYLREAKWTE